MAGAGYKLFNTGDVLTAAQVNTYLMEQTVMVFADAAARTTALTGVVSEGMLSYLKDTNAVEVYNGSAWVSSDDPNAIQNTIVDAKGDLITASAADTPARLASGNNGETLVADTSASTGLRWQAPVQQNPVINSAFQVWQRSTSAALGSAGVVTSADRWATYTGGNGTMSRQLTGDTTNLPNIQYCARIQRNSGETSTAQLQVGQSLETINSIPYAGKTVTLSFYARAGANYSPTSSAFLAFLKTGTGTDQNLVSTGYTGSATPLSTTATLTTTWQRFSVSGTIATTATELGIEFRFTPVGTAGAGDYAEVTGVQLEIGSVATPFKTYGGTLQGELAACQRYYQKTYAIATAPGAAPDSYPFNAINASTTLVVGVPVFKVTMRTAATVTLYSPVTGTSGKIRSGGADITASAADVGENGIGYISATGLTAGSNSAVSYVASAEL